MRSALVPILLADPLPWAQKAEYAWDFLRDRARFGGRYRGLLANTPGWTFTRASTGYAQTSAGALTSFASGELRRTDKGVLLEGARTNLFTYSQQLDLGSGAPWSHTGVTVTANATSAPDGTTTADKIVEVNAAGLPRIANSSLTVSAATAHTFSIYAKAAERDQIRIVQEGSGAFSAYFLLTGVGTISGLGGSAAATITALADGWYRCTLTWTTGGTNPQSYVATASGGSTIASGDNTKGLYLWGAQLEAAAFPSSYIPTTTASATRAADVLTVPVSGLGYPLSLFAETDLVTLAGGSVSQSYFEIDDSSGNNRALLYGTNGGSQASRMYCATANVNQALPTVGSLTTGVRKTAGRCSLNSFQVAGNGTLATEDTSGTVPATPNLLVFGKESGTGTELFGYLRRCAIWPRALTDAELQSVTT